MSPIFARPVLAAAVATLLAQPAVFGPARLTRGEAPRPAPQTVGWEQAVLRAEVDARGAVEAVESLTGTEPLTSALRGSVARWRFEPAREDSEAVASAVLVASIYRPPMLHDVPAFSRLPVGRGILSDAVPLPATMSAPAYPPRGQGDGTVVVEVRLRADGEVESAIARQSSASGFNDSAVQAALRWRFHAATRRGSPVPAFAYLVFGFRQPVVVIK